MSVTRMVTLKLARINQSYEDARMVT